MFDVTKSKITGITELTNPKWVQTNSIHYTDPSGKQRDWEFCSRKTRIPGSDVDGVGIIAISHKAEGPESLLQKQFRPPANGVCIEIPAGLLDPKESVETCAERELREETGYIGKARKVSPLMFNDPGFCNTNTKMVHVDIDLSDPRNQDPQSHLEDGEFIECFSVPVKTLPEEINNSTMQGYVLDARVANLADGIELYRSLNL